MSESTSEIRREMAATRDRMTRDIDDLETRASERVSAAKQRLDVARLLREHPWPALGVAVALGAVIGGSGADEKAAAAAVAGAKHAARASSDAVGGAMYKLHSSDDNARAAVGKPERDKAGLGTRLFDALGAAVALGLDRVLDDVRVASRSWGGRTSEPSRGPRPAEPSTAWRTMPAAPIAAIVVAEEIVARQPAAPATEPVTEADTVPVPNEMLPTEVDARADAVEALGGGTHEPPLAPGAGDLGARWA